ncbi:MULTISPECIES: shikimate kinase [unclassified Microcoleus]|uniref:shikimate kinase n=1 Tax=unclassified Microcoleus TaxID=2642155 RepID=UPI0025DE9309|nr:MULTISPECIES: shikimate kinase [unclassified Microcoleus]
MDLLRGVNIYLVGMMGVGKTTVGRILARELKYRFFDTDELIVRVANQSIAEIFDREGEEAFRELETKVLGELAAYQNSIVATGGGIVARSKNWGYLHYGIVVWLDVPVDQLCDRLRSDSTRPLLREGDLKSKLQGLLSERERFYAQADVRVGISGGERPEEVARRAIEEIKKVLEEGRRKKEEESNGFDN